MSPLRDICGMSTAPALRVIADAQVIPSTLVAAVTVCKTVPYDCPHDLILPLYRPTVTA